jgi:hypothetical protein
MMRVQIQYSYVRSEDARPRMKKTRQAPSQTDI